MQLSHYIMTEKHHNVAATTTRQTTVQNQLRTSNRLQRLAGQDSGFNGIFLSISAYILP